MNSTAIACPTCQSTSWSRREERIVQDVASIETAATAYDGQPMFEFDDEETIETTPLTDFACSNGHRATAEISARLEEWR